MWPLFFGKTSYNPQSGQRENWKVNLEEFARLVVFWPLKRKILYTPLFSEKLNYWLTNVINRNRLLEIKVLHIEAPSTFIRLAPNVWKVLKILPVRRCQTDCLDFLVHAMHGDVSDSDLTYKFSSVGPRNRTFSDYQIGWPFHGPGVGLIAPPNSHGCTGSTIPQQTRALKPEGGLIRLIPWTLCPQRQFWPKRIDLKQLNGR
jgi:hypothetical protein